MPLILRLLLLATLVVGCVHPSTPQEAFSNPVIDTDFPDPAVLKAPDGFYYAYATQTMRNGTQLNLQVARSRDLIHWEHLGDALPAKPRWASRTQNFWAPDVIEDHGRYVLYYSAQPDASLTDPSRGLCLAVATADRPQGPFSDKGEPLLCGNGFEAIDPMAFDDPATGKRLLYWGSGFKPIHVRELAPDRLSFVPGTQVIDLVAADPSEDPANYQRLVEGAWVVTHGGYYYLFYSGDNCCGPKAHYAVMVARSQSATGPFETFSQATGASDSVILRSNSNWIAPGHNSIIEDGSGSSWILYHAVDVGRPRTAASDEVNTRRVMLIDRLDWRGGWPRVGDGTPSIGPTAAPAR